MPTVITGVLKNKVDRVWDAFWSGGISNPLEVIEQITYLLFLRRLDDLQTLKERKAQRTGDPLEDPIFLREDEHLRWSRFKNDDSEVMYKVVSEEVFPFLRGLGKALGGDNSTYSDHMKDARSRSRRPHCWRRSSTCSATSLWRTETPTVTSTSTCSPRSPPRGRTVSSAPHDTSSG